jgi:hypothetical protein
MLERDVPKGVAEGQLNLQHLMSVEIQRCAKQNLAIQRRHSKASLSQKQLKSLELLKANLLA